MSTQPISEDAWRQKVRGAYFDEATESGAYREWCRDRRTLQGGSPGLVEHEDLAEFISLHQQAAAIRAARA